jgi:uncharacterized protein YxeA
MKTILIIILAIVFICIAVSIGLLVSAICQILGAFVDDDFNEFDEYHFNPNQE